MADIIEFPADRGDDVQNEAADDHDGFLLKEGLELLAHYRAIEDVEVRASILRLVALLSRSGQRSAG